MKIIEAIKSGTLTLNKSFKEVFLKHQKVRSPKQNLPTTKDDIYPLPVKTIAPSFENNRGKNRNEKYPLAPKTLFIQSHFW
ncbi:MAG: hypothetical protein C4330_04840 [Chitinophagaceae bacterium]